MGKEALIPYLPQARLDTVLWLHEVDSTQRVLMEAAQNGTAEGTVVIADSQSEGRGRKGRGFLSPAGKGLFLSYYLNPGREPEEEAMLTAWTATAVCDAVSSVCGKTGLRVKWVNDLILNRKKVGGILAQRLPIGVPGAPEGIVIGIGLNLGETKEDFPAELKDSATSFQIETGTFPERTRLAASLILALDRMKDDFPTEKSRYLAAYRSLCLTVGQKVRFFSEGTERTGLALSVGEDFSLRVKEEETGRETVLRSGEVSVRGITGYAV